MLEEAGGFEQWKKDGFPGRVRANIKVDFPLVNTDKNNYVVLIEGGVGIIMQEDEKPVKEWEWLMNTEVNEDTQNAEFNGILKYLGQKDEDEFPVFLISDVKEGYHLAYALEEEDYIENDLEWLMGQPEKVLEELGFTYDENDMQYSFLDGNIFADCMDGKIYMIGMEGSGSNLPCFHGIKIGMSIKEADVLLADKYNKVSGESNNIDEEGNNIEYIDIDSGNSLTLSNANGRITGILVIHLEELQNTKTDMSSIEMYLTNNSENLPVKIENVYQESVYMGFTTIDFDMVNITDVDIKKATFGIVAWDSNMLPLELTAMYDIESTYLYRCQGSNIAAGQTSQASLSFEERDFKYMQILLLEYTDFDGNTWTNPMETYYEENFAGKKFDENTMTAMIFDADNINNTNDMNGDINDDIESQKDIVNCTGDFFMDVANGILYGKDGIIVDVNGNALSEYEDYFVTEEGYISNGDWVEEGYITDDTGKIIKFQF